MEKRQETYKKTNNRLALDLDNDGDYQYSLQDTLKPKLSTSNSSFLTPRIGKSWSNSSFSESFQLPSPARSFEIPNIVRASHDFAISSTKKKKSIKIKKGVSVIMINNRRVSKNFLLDKID